MMIGLSASTSYRMMLGSGLPAVVVGLVLLWMPQAHGAEGISPSTHAASYRYSRPALPPSSVWPHGDRGRHLRLELDVDRDDAVDVLEVFYDAGSGFSNKKAEFTLGENGVKLQAEAGLSFSTMTAIDAVPKELLGARHRAGLEWIEEALFDQICALPDPSLAWLLQPRKRLTWIEGPPELPDSYAIRLPAGRIAGLSLEAYMSGLDTGNEIDPEGEVWLLYQGFHHAIRRTTPVELARQGDHVLLGTARGVILTNPRQSRHAWIYVSEGCHMAGMFRPPIPCINAAHLQGESG
jgi:hypothetical protein